MRSWAGTPPQWVRDLAYQCSTKPGTMPLPTSAYHGGMRERSWEFWEQHSGISPGSRAAREAMASNAAAHERPGTESLTAGQIARRLGLPTAVIRGRAAGRRLYAYRRDGDLLFPEWQFTTSGDTVIPHLHSILAALPEDAHPDTIAGFFLTEQPDLVLGGQAVSVRDWLKAGAPPEFVMEMARDLTAGY